VAGFIVCGLLFVPGRNGQATVAVIEGDPTHQTQAVASINRDTSNLNGTVSKLPDVQQLLSQQADLMSGAQAAGQVVAQAIGTYAQGKQNEAQEQADVAKAAGNTELAAQYQAVADSWAEGGSNRIALHVAGGALLGGLGGGGFGSALQGAAGAGLSSALATQLDSLSKGVADSTGSTLLGSLTSNVLAGAGGALVGGGTGAFTAANADLYNRQLHPDEKKAIADKANGDQAEADKLTRAACYAVKCWAEYAPGSTEYNAN
jgi:filamentous hemagglutinin